MDKNAFLTALQDVFQRDEAVGEQDCLTDYSEWDSLSKMALMAFFDKHFNIQINLEDLKNVESVAQLVELAGDKLH
jgi:acyl carrier protein